MDVQSVMVNSLRYALYLQKYAFIVGLRHSSATEATRYSMVWAYEHSSKTSGQREEGGTLPLNCYKTFPGPIRSYTVKEDHKILWYKQTDRQTFYFLSSLFEKKEIKVE